jgi:hypothetical protein
MGVGEDVDVDGRSLLLFRHCPWASFVVRFSL